MTDPHNKATSKLVLKKNKVLIGCTGSVASIKIPLLVQELLSLKYKVEVQVVCTEHSKHFFNPATLPVEVHTDEDEWKTWTKMGDSVLHIELRRWADIFVIAPLDANTLGKLASGICDNLLTCVARAWDLQRPLLFAPAMNTFMWEHPVTSSQIETLENFGYSLIPTIKKTLACGDTGFGAMAEVPSIVARIVEELEQINGIQ